MIRQAASSVRLSADVIQYLMDKGFKQDEIARNLGLTVSMISHVRNQRKALSLDSLQRVETMLNTPLGVVLLEATLGSGSREDPNLKPLASAARKFMAAADKARAAIKGV
jgi:transcriptional regulator with XRE-family HTH domain